MNKSIYSNSLYWIIIFTIPFIFSCGNDHDLADAYGNFESKDQIVSAESAGKLIHFRVEEGQILKAGDQIGLVDTSSLYLKKKQVLASIKAIRGKLQDPGPQVDLIKAQKDVLIREKNRVTRLLANEAATQKQLDDIEGQLEILSQQIKTTEEQSKIANRALLSQIAPLEAQIESIEDQIRKCHISNPMNGTVLLKLAEEGEMVSPVKALYKIADVSIMELRAYMSGDQLAKTSIGQTVWIEIDQEDSDKKRMEGKISWISDQAEFTPKTIQTREERVNLVYAFKVKVKNPEGILKIGMPGEVYFSKTSEEE